MELTKMRWKGYLGLNKEQKLLREGVDEVEKEFIEFLGVIGLEMWVDVEDMFFLGVDFGAIVIGFVDELGGYLKEFFIDFWQIWIKWLLFPLFVVFLVGLHQFSERSLLLVSGF